MTQEDRNRRYTLVGVALVMFLGALDQTIVSTALPRMVSDLGGLERYGWVFSTYILVSTMVVPIYGKLADIIDKKILMIGSTLTFLVGSMLCGMAGEWGSLPVLGDGMYQLIVFRGVQGLGGGGLFALAFIIISDLYPPRERSKIGGLFGAIFGLSSVLGPLAGGLLTDHAGPWISGIEGWRWVFYVNFPIGIVALWFLLARMPHLPPADKSHAFDFVSAILMVATFFPLVLALELDKNLYPWGSHQVLVPLLGSFGAMALWIWHSLKISKHPVLDLTLFRNRVFTLGNVATFFFGAAFISFIIFLPLYMVQVQGVSATRAGMSVIPMTAGIVLGAGLGGPVASRLGRYKMILVLGAAVSLLGALLMLMLGVETSMAMAISFMVVVGLGFGPAQSLYSIAVQNAVPHEEIGQATSFNQFSRQIGSTVAAAVLGAVFSAALSSAMVTHMPPSAGATFDAGSGRMAQAPADIRARIEEGFNHGIRELTGKIDGLQASKGPVPPGVLAGLEKGRADLIETREKTVQSVLDGIRHSFAEAIHQVLIGSLVIVLLLLLSTLLLPSLPLRGRDKGASPPPGGH